MICSMFFFIEDSVNVLLPNSSETSWWFQPIWKILLKLDHETPIFGVKIPKKCLSCHHLGKYWQNTNLKPEFFVTIWKEKKNIQTLVPHPNLGSPSKPWFPIQTLVPHPNLGSPSKPWFPIQTLVPHPNLGSPSKPWFPIQTLVPHPNPNLGSPSKPWFPIQTLVPHPNLGSLVHCQNTLKSLHVLGSINSFYWGWETSHLQ